MGLDMYLTADISCADPDPRARAVFETIGRLYPEGVVAGGQFDEGLPLYDMGMLFNEKEPDQRKARLCVVIERNFPVVYKDNHWIGGYFTSARLQLPLMYWRKANQIHAWFVRETQGGDDQCQSSVVTRDKLFELRKTLKAIEADPAAAPDLLPAAPGFFFGSYDYDEWYFENLKATRAMLDRICEKGLTENTTIYYQASW